MLDGYEDGLENGDDRMLSSCGEVNDVYRE